MSGATLAAVVSAASAIVVACLSALAAYLASKRERRRALYSEAVKAALAWEEMVYRVRRRAEGQERDLVEHGHEVQERQTYFCAWVGSESKYMKRSYDGLVAEIKRCTKDLINKAWEEELRPAPGNARPNDEHPDTTRCVDAFLKDVRSHLSPWPWRKLAVVWRNRIRSNAG